MDIGFRYKFIIGLFLLLTCIIPQVIAADLTDEYVNSKPRGNTFDKKQWERLKDDYKYKSPDIDTTKKERSAQKRPFSIDGGAWMRLLAYAAIFLLLGGLIYLIVRNGLGVNKKFQNKPIGFNIIEEPKDINDLYIDPLLAEALKREDYRLALRLRFLALLQILNQKQLIHWKRDSTNQNYIKQLHGTKIELSFRQVCLIYETVWYGNYPIDKNHYQTVSNKFDFITQSIIANEHA